MKVYLAGPINGCSDEEANGWRSEAKRVFPEVLDPMDRDYRGREDDNFEQIVREDKEEIRKADVILAWCSRVSWGTAMEIMYAKEHFKPVIAVVPSGDISPWLRAHAEIVSDLEGARRAVLCLPVNHYYETPR